MIDDFRPAPAPKLVPEEAPKPTPVPKPTFQTPEQVAVRQEIPSPRIEETPEQAMVFDSLAKREKPRGSPSMPRRAARPATPHRRSDSDRR